MPDSTLLQLRDLAFVLGVTLVLVVGMGLYVVRRYRSTTNEDQPYYPEAREFQGQGTATVEAGELIAAQYRVDYQFPTDVLVKVELVETATGNSDLILLKSGSGIDGFLIENAGFYLFEVEPQSEEARWTFTVKPVGLMSEA